MIYFKFDDSNFDREAHVYDSNFADNSPMTREKYIIEVRDQDGKLDFGSEKLRRKEHPYLFSKPEFTIDKLCYYASYGQQRNNPSGPMQLGQFMNQIGISYRVKTW